MKETDLEIKRHKMVRFCHPRNKVRAILLNHITSGSFILSENIFPIGRTIKTVIQNNLTS
jgi:hypothetical protein